MAKKSAGNAALTVDFSIFNGKKAETVFSIPLTGESHEQLAMTWRYKMKQRQRWSTDDRLLKQMEQHAGEALNKLGIKAAQLKKLAGQSSPNQDSTNFVDTLIEIAIPWHGEDIGWWARIMPWEFIVSAATKRYRGRRKRVVVRRLVCKEERSTKRKMHPESFSILKAAPGKIGEVYDFFDEEQLVETALKDLSKKDLHKSCGVEPDVGSIARWLKKSGNSPDILHITGVDSKLGAQILQRRMPPKDGLLLGGHGDPIDVEAEEFAKHVFGEYQPNLVSFNLWNSGARMAPLAIAYGAGAAIGFEETFDDSIAERFFAQFYRLYSGSNWMIGKAFCDALRSVGPLRERTQGSSIILWTRDSLLVPITQDQMNSMHRELELVIADPEKHKARDLLRVEVEPAERLNYAFLHNRGSLIKRLKLGLSSGPAKDINTMRDIEVKVDLCAGGETFPYRTKLDLVPDENVVDIANTSLNETPNHGAGGVYIPLTSDLMRSVDEAMLTSVNVSVVWEQQAVYNRTFPVQLAPVDEWRFEEDQVIWMPSFVHPRDPAVGRIIDSAQRYLSCLADDYTTAGFSGYQAYDPDLDDPWIGVEKQVQAIWTAISLDFNLGYINPPPSYSENSQRLRTPSRVLSERRGTCVDLALLMAACLEWVEIYPVIFNLNDHAFPGYWRSSEAYDKFQCDPKMHSESTDLVDSSLNTETFLPWNSPKSAYAEIRSVINKPHAGLVPMETVALTSKTGFAAAVDRARGYFSEPTSDDFYSMIDVCRSRERVTPIPLNAILNHRGGSNG